MGKRILRTIFAIAVIASIIFAIGVAASMLQPTDSADVDKLAAAFALPYGMIVVTVLLTVECELYRLLKYFLFDKERRTVWRTVINGLSLVTISAFVLFSLADVLFLTKGFYAMQIGILVFPVVIVLKLVYFVIDLAKE